MKKIIKYKQATQNERQKGKKGEGREWKGEESGEEETTRK